MMKKCYNGLFLLLGSLLLTFVCVLNSGPAAAQTFPVQSNLQLVPPYSLALPGYVAPGSEKLVLNATLTDISRPQLDVELRVLIEGQGIRIQTNPRVNIRPITLAPGIPVRLSGSDLEPYFRAENLQFFGLSRQQFITNGGALPEGIYRFCIDIVEANREVAIASRACGTAWLVLNDPPIVNLPRDQQKLAPVDPQFVRFQWTPRHTGSPNSAFTTEYDFQLVEVWPKGRNPNDAILTTTPIYETTTAATSLIYGPGEPALVRGRQYAFRIRARSIAGVEQLDLFRNEGFTQVQSFTYGDECIEPQGVAVEAISSRKLEVTWDAAPVHSGYLLEYREQGATDWMEERILFSDYTINGLAPRTNYEVQVFGFCGIAISEGSKVLKTKTQAEILGDFSCGSPPEAFNLENRTPLEQLQQGDVIDAGDFKVTMVEVSGSNGTFSGTGQLVVPMLNNVKAGTTFSNIKVNDEYRMYAGSMNFTGVTVQVLPGEILDDINNFFDDVLAFEEDLNKTLDVAQVVADSINSLVEEIQNTEVFTKEEYTDLVSEETTIEELQEEVKKSLGDAGGAATGGNIVEAAKQVARAKTLGKRVKDKKEQATHIDTIQIAAVRFLEGGSRGYDLGPGHNGIEPNYYKLITHRGAEHGPWYAVQSGQQARIQVEWLSGSNIPKEDISFTLADASITALASRNGWELTVPASSPGDRRVLKALANGNTVGIAAVATYAQETRKVTLVRVNDAPAPSAGEAQDYLNRVYGPAVVQWEVDGTSVTIDDSWDLNGNGSMYIDENNDLSTYPDEAKAFIRAVRNSEGFERANDSYYMLFTDVTNSSNAAGFMPRKKQFGFVFTSVDESSKGLKHTLAHELGHGAFRLAHPWVEFPNLREGQTQNLMDYGRGENLRKYQWDQVHDPKWVVTLFDDEEEAYIVDSEGNTSSSGSSGGSDNPTPGNDLDIPDLKQQLVTEVLTEFEKELEGWLSTYGKGPLSQEEMLAMMALPDYVPEDAAMVEGILNYVGQVKESPEEFTNNLLSEEATQQVVDDLLKEVDASSPIQDQLDETQWQQAQTLIQGKAVDWGLLDWFTSLPYRERAAKVLKEHLESQGMFDEVWIDESNKAKIHATLTLSEDASLEQEIDLNTIAEKDIQDVLILNYKVPFWEAYDTKLEGWERVVNWLRIQDAKIARQEGWQVGVANFVADVVNAPYGAVHGWVTGEHWRTGQELAWWEQVLGILDVVPGEALAKAGITALVIKIAGKAFDFTKVTNATKNLILTAKSAGVKMLVRTTDEIILYGKNGTQQIGRWVNGVLQDIYWVYGGEKVLAKLAGVKYIVDNRAVQGAVNIVEEAGEIGLHLADQGEEFASLAAKRLLPGKASGSGTEITGKWLRGTEGNSGLFPKSVANKLKGMDFKDFNDFRKAFWKAVADDSNLSKQFISQNIERMKDGLAPSVRQSQRLGNQRSYILHHRAPINTGGAVYDMDNLVIVTPRYHKDILDPKYHFGYGYE